MTNPDEETMIPVSRRAGDKLTRAKREGESYSDVIIRLTSTTLEGLRRRGELEVVTSDRRKLSVSVEQDKCLGAMSCVSLAPGIFALDRTQLGFTLKRQEPLGMRDVGEGEIDSDTIIRAAESCPYRAILVKDVETGEEIVH
ncbi:MAG: ferredoxin [Thaumarchaeota archaeon]|nr:ferredoxin [Nitrososphaerota archaeon]